MKKKIIIILTTIILPIFALGIAWDLYVYIEMSNRGFEFTRPLICRRERIELVDDDIFTEEIMEKMYLSKWQAKSILKKIKSNTHWKYGEIDSEVDRVLKLYTREDIYNQIPFIENKYWIFTNRSKRTKEPHNVSSVEKTTYYAITFGLFDVDKNILYYYQYDN